MIYEIFFNKLNLIYQEALDSGYYKQDIPSVIDHQLMSLLKESVNVIQIDSKKLSESYRIFNLFAERMATLAVREKKIEWVKLGVFGLCRFSLDKDYREAVSILSLLYDAIVRIGDTPKIIFKEVELNTSGTMFIESFLNRSEADKTINAMGYETIGNGNDFLYRRTW